MATHHLKLATEPYQAIERGVKVIESRLYDEKRRTIDLNDEIVFTNREDSSRSLAVRVIGLLRYSTFEALFSDNEPTKFGKSSVEELLEQISEFYSEDEQARYGVLGIRIELLQ